jgi:putative tricarboxylic transport membrane protein
MRPNSRTADRVTAIVFFILGGAMAYGGFVMDRLEVRHIHPASIPGLVPMILGAMLMFCAVFLAVGTFAESETISETSESDATGTSWGSFLFTAVWSGFYALVMVGSMPFALATAIYIAVFSGYFLWRDGSHERPARTALIVAVFAGVMAVGISALFQYGFLVRLP